jgi:thioredoxin reductase
MSRFVLFLACFLVSESLQTLPVVDHIIVGAGGAGLQAALQFQKRNMSYIVLERDRVVGSFWTRFPVFGELISINKWVRNATQQMRFDWHSLLDAPLSMLNITDRYFPRSSELQEYFARVAREAQLNIVTDLNVLRIHPSRPCVVLVGEKEYCARRRVLIATGLRPKSEPVLEALGGIPYQRFRREMAYRKRVCIIGNGNSGYEVAQNVYDIAERVVITGNSPAKLSAVTKYTGDVRTKFLQVVENFHGKLLDTAYHHEVLVVPRVSSLDGKISPDEEMQTDLQHSLQALNYLRDYHCEVAVICTGFQSVIPGLSLPRKRRFPATLDWYADVQNPSVHYIGWLMHERDFQQGAGGFLSGYRYLV